MAQGVLGETHQRFTLKLRVKAALLTLWDETRSGPNRKIIVIGLGNALQ
jgi:hypothetical protein